MTDRIKGFTVVLDKNYRDDDVEAIKQTLEMIKGVVHVEPHVAGFDDIMVESRAKLEIREQLYEFIQEKLKP